MGESGCLIVQPKEGGILHLRLNNGERPIAHKYRKGKMQRTLNRELKELEVVGREAIVTCGERQSGKGSLKFLGIHRWLRSSLPSHPRLLEHP